MNQLKLEVITRSRHKARENVHAQATISFGFTSDWLKKGRQNFEPITEWRNAKPKQFTNYFRQLKTALYIHDQMYLPHCHTKFLVWTELNSLSFITEPLLCQLNQLGILGSKWRITYYTGLFQFLILSLYILSCLLFFNGVPFSDFLSGTLSKHFLIRLICLLKSIWF